MDKGYGMITRIKSVTSVNQQGTSFYKVGGVINGLVIDRIDYSVLKKGLGYSITGLTSPDYDVVFKLVNVPVDIQYELE